MKQVNNKVIDQFNLIENPIDLSPGLIVVRVNESIFAELAEEIKQGLKRYSHTLQDEFHEFIKVTHKCKNESFIITSGGIPLVLTTVLVHQKSINNVVIALTPFGDGLPPPVFNKRLSIKQKRSLYNYIYNELSSIGGKYGSEGANTYYECSHIDLCLNELYDNFAIRALDVQPKIEYETIISLDLPEERLWADLRHSYKSIINKGLKLYSFTHLIGSEISKEHLDLHRELHKIAAGRETRSIESHHKMYEMVKAGKGMFTVQSLGGQPVQTLYTLFGKNTAYGGSMAADRALVKGTPPTHSLNWKMMLKLKEIGISYYYTRYTSLWSPDVQDQKQANKLKDLAVFKAGFGGQYSPVLILSQKILGFRVT